MNRIYQNVNVELSEKHSKFMRNTADILRNQILRRCGATFAQCENALKIKLAWDSSIEEDGYRITDTGEPDEILVTGRETRGLLYGVGKFLRTSQYAANGFIPGTWRGKSVPQKSVRGIYFATHFHNFYQQAPLSELETYVEEMALWGYNSLALWYDMHHFSCFDDPQAVEFRKKLQGVAQCALRLGLKLEITLVGNEGHKDVPAAFRAVPGAQRGGWYPSQVCPGTPGGERYLLENFGRYFDFLISSGIQPDHLWLWPYDQGGCACAECAPSGGSWGRDGFIKIAGKIARLAAEKMPGVPCRLSTWYFDAQEWDKIKILVEKDALWFDSLIVANPSEFPLSIPMVNFPEISMYDMFPWGGFGATASPERFQKEWDCAKHLLQGGFPYSEGIFEDMNKVIFSQFYWNDQPARETLKEYISFEFGPEFVSPLLNVIRIIERNHHMRWWPEMLKGKKLELDWFPCKGLPPCEDPEAEEAYRIVKEIDTELSPAAKRNWRWRHLYLRVLLDAELKTNHGSPNELCNAAFKELIQIYHAQDAEPHTRPPLP